MTSKKVTYKDLELAAYRGGTEAWRDMHQETGFSRASGLRAIKSLSQDELFCQDDQNLLAKFRRCLEELCPAEATSKRAPDIGEERRYIVGGRLETGGSYIRMQTGPMGNKGDTGIVRYDTAAGAIKQLQKLPEDTVVLIVRRAAYGVDINPHEDEQLGTVGKTTVAA